MRRLSLIILFFIVFLTCAAGRESVVYGTVTFDDGSAAPGIAVSDGFSVVRTDEAGHYSLTTVGGDVRYIYVSLPSNAKVNLNSDGQPDFFKVYDSSVSEYDFILTKASSENKFMLFALSDPQVHYKARGGKKENTRQFYSDIERFAKESVPAINAELALQSLPCYSVCLGDLVYNEGNRNSTKAMPLMKAAIARLDVPVFNVMGNHDYTFFKKGEAIATDESSSINLLSQRSYESVFGPVNYSFERGDVHFVCMKDTYFKCTDTWAWDNYEGGFTDLQYEWLRQDLECVPKNKLIVLCIHVPLSYSTNGPNVEKVLSLLDGFDNAEIFSGDAHYQYGVQNVCGSRFFEKVHPTLCGQWWWSNIQGDGCPNGYLVYTFDGNRISDSFFIGVNEGMNRRSQQMRVYRGDLCFGGRYARFKYPHSSSDYFINVFNGDSRWRVKVYENGRYKGDARLMDATFDTFAPIAEGTDYDIPASSSMDWWATGYHIGVCGRGMNGTSYYTHNFHMWRWKAGSRAKKLKFVALDPYGNEYVCTDIVSDGMMYPDCMKVKLIHKDESR